MTTTQLISGLGGAIGSDFLSARNRLLFVEYSGKLSRYDLFPAASIVSQGSAVLKGTFHFDLDNGTQQAQGAPTPPGADIWWVQETAVQRWMAPANGATIVNVGVASFASVLPAALPGLAYGSANIDGNNDATNKLVTGDVFAVKTTQGNFAKVQVTSYGYDMGIEWVTYSTASAYAVLGTGYNQPEDVAASSDGQHVFVIERAGNLLKVPLSSANRASAVVVSSGMTAPQQLVLDEAHGFAYVVEYAASGRLLRISLANGAQTVVLSGLNFAVGLAMSADGQTAYVSEQTANASAGSVNKYALPGAAKTVLATGLTQPFFLTWSDATQTTLYVTERSPVNAVVAVGVTTPPTKAIVATGLGNMPSCVAVVSPGNLLVTTNEDLDELSLGPVMEAGEPLLQGIGWVPISYITAGGLANTAADPANFYQVANAPFAGSLPVMVNFLEALSIGAAYYQVAVNGVVRTDQFNTTKWDGTTYAPAVFRTQTINGAAYYAVPTITDLELWYPGLPGCYLDSTTLPNAATSTIQVTFFNSSLAPIAFAPANPPVDPPITVYVDNTPAKAGISSPVLNGVSATVACGYLQYKPATELTDKISIAYTASQPQGHANYSFNVIRGIGTEVGSAGGPVPASASPFSGTVASLMGSCTIAGFAASVYVATTATTGWGRAGGLDAEAAIAFVLAPS